MKTVVYLGKRCTECYACACICSENISMPTDGEGFLYPSVDVKKCNGCWKCLKSYPIANKHEISETQSELEVYPTWWGYSRYIPDSISSQLSLLPSLNDDCLPPLNESTMSSGCYDAGFRD